MSINVRREGAGITEPSPDEAKFTQNDVDRIVGERLARDRQVRVVREPRVYGLASPFSYYADIWLSQQDPPQEASVRAKERLDRYARELVEEIEQDTAEGRRAHDIIRARLRSFDVRENEQQFREAMSELRAMTTGGGTTASAAGGGAAAFVSPAFLNAAWAPFRGAVRAFADQCMKLSLPPFGMTVYIPYVATSDSVTPQTEGGAVSDSDPSSSLQPGSVQTATGQITLTQQLADRAYSGGGSMDVILHAQLEQQLDAAVDVIAINAAIANGEAVSGASSYTTKALYEDQAKAREKLTDTAGNRLRPTHIFTTSDQYSFATRQLDNSERPILVPQFVPGFPINDTANADKGDREVWANFTGTVMPGGVLWFTDDNIPAVGTTNKTQVIVSAPGDAIALMEDEPVLSVFPQTKAEKLEVILNLREYVSVVTRHAAGTATITGNAYTTSQV